MVATGVGAKYGILFKGGVPLEVMGTVTRVIFDKTGTLTEGQPSVIHSDSKIFESKGLTEDDVWSLIAATESTTEHVIGKVIFNYARSHLDVKSLPVPSGVSNVVGMGVAATVDSRQVAVGNRLWMAQNKVQM